MKLARSMNTAGPRSLTSRIARNLAVSAAAPASPSVLLAMRLKKSAVEVRAVQLVDQKPLLSTDRLQEVPLLERQPRFLVWLQATDRLVGRPVGGRSRKRVARTETGIGSERSYDLCKRRLCCSRRPR